MCTKEPYPQLVLNCVLERDSYSDRTNSFEMFTRSRSCRSSQNPECTALKDCFPKLVAAVKKSPNTIGDKLHAEGILSDDDQKYVHNKTHTPDEKARRIIRKVEGSVSQESYKFEIFVEVLRSEGEWTKDTVEALISSYQQKIRDADSSPAPHLTAESLEYSSLRKCYPQLVDLVAQSPNTIGGQLFAKSILSPQEHGDLQTSATSDREKAQRIMHTVNNRVLHNTRKFEVFIQVLKSEGDWTNDTVSLLETTNEREQGNSQAALSITSPPTSATAAPSITSRPTSTSTEEKNVYDDYADSKKLEDLESEYNENDLRCETDDIILKFAGLIVKLVACLKRCNVSVEDLVFFLGQITAIEPVLITDKRHRPGSLLDEKYLDDLVRECKTTKQVFDKIKHYYSWFNHSLIDQIVETCCNQDAEFQAVYRAYKETFKLYCQNRLCRVPKGVLGNSRHRTKTVIFKVDQNWNTVKISQVSSIKKSLCKLFRIKKEALFLRSARKGCVELLFDVPDFVAELIMSLTPETEEALHKAGIRKVYSISATTLKAEEPTASSMAQSDLELAKAKKPTKTEHDPVTKKHLAIFEQNNHVVRYRKRKSMAIEETQKLYISQ